VEGTGRKGEAAGLLAGIARAKTRVTHLTQLKSIDAEEKGEEAEEEREEGKTKQNE
jgi:hypothetical protein